MPPKKKSEKLAASEKTTKEKAPRKRAIKEKVEKPKLKSPTVMRLKLPSIKSFLNCPKVNSSPNIGKKDSPALSPVAQRKLDLANEVALAQLVKPNGTTKSIAESVTAKPAARKQIKPQAQGPKPKGRSKKKNIETEVSDAPALTTEDSEVASIPDIKQKKKKDLVKKVPLKKEKLKTKPESKVIAKASDNQKAIADSTSTELKIKRKVVRKQKVPQCDDPQPDAERTAHEPKASSTLEKKTIRKGKNKMLTEVSTTDHNQSPSLLKEVSKILEKEGSQPKENQPSPAPIDSRKTSSSECLSWTKDISSSSTTTCKTVGSNDFVRIDKKLPVLQLSNVGNEWGKVNKNQIPEESEGEGAMSSSSSSSGSSSSGSSSSSSSDGQSNRNSMRQSLNLSASSVSPSRSVVTRTSITKDEDWDYTLKKLTANLKKLDAEAISWVGYKNQTTDIKIDFIENKIFKLLKFERHVLELCSNIKNCFETVNDGIDKHDVQKLPIELDPNAFIDKSEDDNFQSTQSRYVMFDQNRSPEENSLQTKVYNDEVNNSEEDNFEDDTAPFEQTDDDDALSLFAESITGLESSRYNSSANSLSANVSDNEEYIPPMTSKHRLSDIHKYVPTKINNEAQNYKMKIICEKQNADSTSVVARESEHNRNEGNNKTFDRQQTPNAPQTIVRQFAGKMPPQAQKRPVLMMQTHKPLRGTKSIVFRGVCFYNLISNCKKMRCNYPHVELGSIEVRNRLSRLTEELFIQEYMLLRNWPSLRRRYGKLYVMACQDRKLTRILVEMAIDFIFKAKQDSVEDAALKINVSEKTLLHLNEKDLSTCDDLLRFNFGKNILLCHELLRIVSESQNFSRFKAVFIKLTNFMKNIGLTFELDVTNHILERVCILPFEESLARAMYTMVQSTDEKIFENSLIPTFEKQISSLDQETYDGYCAYKENAILKLKQAQVANENAMSPKKSQELDMNLIHANREERYTSPDTTKIENSNKPTDETPQTVKIIRPSLFKFSNQSSSSAAQNEEMEDAIKKRQMFRWRGRGYFNPRIIGMRRPQPLVRSLPPPLKRRLDQRLIALGATPSKFPRHPGPGFL